MPELSPGHLRGMKVAVPGASGNLGTALLRRLPAPSAGVAEVRGLARRQPPDLPPYSAVRWHLTDLGEAAGEQVVAEVVDGGDAVVHPAGAPPPGRPPHPLRGGHGDRTPPGGRPPPAP